MKKLEVADLCHAQNQMQGVPHHVVAASVLLDGGEALGALLRVGRDPVVGLRVVVALLDPFLDQVASGIPQKYNSSQPRLGRCIA